MVSNWYNLRTQEVRESMSGKYQHENAIYIISYHGKWKPTMSRQVMLVAKLILHSTHRNPSFGWMEMMSWIEDLLYLDERKIWQSYTMYVFCLRIGFSASITTLPTKSEICQAFLREEICEEALTQVTANANVKETCIQAQDWQSEFLEMWQQEMHWKHWD